MKVVALISSIFCSPKLRELFYYIFYFHVRYVFIDLVSYLFGNSLICNGPKDPITAAITNVIIYITSCPIAWISATMIYGFVKYVYSAQYYWRRQESKKDQWVWRQGLKMWRKAIRHAHFPMDILSMIYYWVVTLNRMVIFEGDCVPVIVHDFDQADDEAWPQCSLLHSIALYRCNKCQDGNRIDLVQSSLYRRISRTICSVPLHEKFLERPDCQIEINYGCQSGGLIFIFVMGNFQDPTIDSLISLDIYNMRTKKVIPFDTSIFPNTWTPFYFFRDHIQNETPNTIYIRVLYEANYIGAFGIGQALVEFPIDISSRVPVILFNQEIFFPSPWQIIGSFLLHRSSRRTGVILKLHHPDHQDITWRCLCVYDADEQCLKTGSDYQIFSQGDQVYSLCATRYLAQLPDNIFPPPIIVLTPSQAMVVYSGLPLWSTNFQPPSLKEICLNALFKAPQRSHIVDMDGQEWKCATGVNLDQHFV